LAVRLDYSVWNATYTSNIGINHPADLNKDGTVDITDLVLVTGIYGFVSGGEGWIPEADLSTPYGKIDILDPVTIAAHYGEDYS
jgi:hypothetical protein